MARVSIIIPSRNERFLTQTIEGILASAAGDIEVLAHIDENPPDRVVDDKRVKYIYAERPAGMRGGIQACVKASTGQYLLKTDGHCLYMPGFDTALTADMQDNWIVIPRRYSLDAEHWTIEQTNHKIRDYHYLCYPSPNKDHDHGMHGVEWPQRRQERADSKYDIDDTPSFQGSCWFMKREWFTDFLDGMPSLNYGVFAQEPQQIGNATWLGGGEIKVNKKVWYAHLHKGKQYGRMYKISQTEIINGHDWSAWYWMNNSWEKQIYPISWLIKKFWPMPTWDARWTEDWDGSFEIWKKEFQQWIKPAL